MQSNRIIIIGSGGVATQIGRLFKNKGCSIIQILGRSASSAKALSATLQCPYVLDPAELNQQADLYIIAVQDREIEPLIQTVKIPENAVIVHTAGGVSIEVFNGHFTRYGVLYPLQSLRKETTEVPIIPFYIDANAKAVKDSLQSFCIRAQLTYQWADDKQRMQLHIAAVFCSNFTNYLYSLAEKLCKEHQLDFSSLLPLVEETAKRLQREGVSPANLQTGPAIRADLPTLQKHLDILQTDREARAIYQYISDKIMDSTIFNQK